MIFLGRNNSKYTNKRFIKKKLIERDGKGCVYCQSNYNITTDHIIPLSRNGSKCGRYNLVLACKKCNRKKGSTGIKTFLDENNIKTKNKTILAQIGRISMVKGDESKVKGIINAKTNKRK